MRPSRIPLAILVGGVIVATAVYVSLKPDPAKVGDGQTYDVSLLRPVDSTDHILGNPAAPVKIIEYSDFDCEYCAHFEDTLHQIVANEGADGSVAWVFRQFPLTEIHPNAFAHARVSECVAQTTGNDDFWKFTTALYKNQPLDPSRYSAIASEVAIKGDAFATCYAEGSATIDTRILLDRQNALDMGGRGTPFSLIVVEGKPPIVMDGAYSYDAVRELIEKAKESSPAN